MKFLTKTRNHLIIFLIVHIGLFFLYGYHEYYSYRPYSIHQWRQSDCLSFTKNYYEEGMHFFEPKIHWQGVPEGKTVSEFPLVNYSVAALWKLFGEHEYIYRFLELFIYFVSLMLLFVTVKRISESWLYAYLATIFISTSPLLAYYSFNFLADVPAFSFALMGLSFYYLFIRSGNFKQFVYALFFASLAVLLKASAITVLGIIGLLTVLNIFGIKISSHQPARLFKNKWMAMLLMGAFTFLIILWYRFAILYNGGNKNGVFLLTALPVWKMKDADKIIETTRILFSNQITMFFNKGALMIITLLFLWLIFQLKHLERYLRISLLMAAVSFLLYIIFFYEVFNIHDYYLINEMIFPVIILIAAGDYLKKKNFRFSYPPFVALSLIIMFFFAVFCGSVIRLRNLKEDNLTSWFPFLTNEEKNFWNWYHWNYERTLKPLETISPFLREMGIKREDKVISIPDQSFNITLYLMDQKGFSGTGLNFQTDTNFIDKKIKQGANYLIINDAEIKKEPGIKKHLSNLIGQYQTVEIYKLN